MIFLIDTNTVSYIVRGKSNAARKMLAELSGGDVGCISSITEAEIRYGLAKRPEAVALRRAVEGFLARIKVLPWGHGEAIAYGELRATLEAKGWALENMDMLIAAHALAVEATLVTNDQAFQYVKGLNGIANWAVDL